MSRQPDKNDKAEVRHDLSLARRDPRERERERLSPKDLDWGVLVRLFSYTSGIRAKRNTLFGLVFLRGFQGPVLAFMLGAIISGPVANRDLAGILWGTAAFAAWALFTAVTFHFRTRLGLQIGETVVHELRNKLFGHLMRQPMVYFDRARLGRIISRMTSDIETVRQGVQNVVFVSIVQLLQMLGAAAFMLWYSWRLFLIILAVAPIVHVLNRVFRKRMSEAARLLQESFSRVTATIAESVKGIKVTQGFAREARNAAMFRELAADHAEYNIHAAKAAAFYHPTLQLLSDLSLAAMLVLGGYWVLLPGDPMPVGDLIGFFFLTNHFFGPISSLGRQFDIALRSMAGAERVFRLLDTEPEWEDAPEARPLPPIAGRVEFDKVTFHYSPDKPVLKEVSFSVEPGETIALVGHTGSGKTTIISLLSKFYLPIDGEIRIDGHEIRTIQGESLHEQMGIVLQNNFLFRGTVMENVRLGKPDATDDEVIAAVEALNCRDLIEAMPNGFQSDISEDGHGLSQGQRQIVCFARAFIAQPRILIFDEATSAVDTMTEARLQQALDKLLAGRTCFVVAHRLSTIRNADKILVLDHGRIVEQGNHRSLLQQRGTYASLYRQFALASVA